jgi:hypothetical protein
MKRRFAEVVLSSFRDDTLLPAAHTLASASPAQWARGLRWLDESGLALYFLERLTTAGLTHILPADVRCRLSRNLADNRAQSADLLDEFVSINQVFQPLRLRYATLKGFSLIPDYSPDPALRCQFDFDFLVDRTAANSFADALHALGYRTVQSGKSAWEFKKHTARVASVRDLYKRNFVRAHREHESLWKEVRALAGNRSDVAIAIAATTVFATMAFGDFSPPALTEWTARALPVPVRRWCEKYGRTLLLANFPGTKLYLLLQRELMNDQEWRRLRRARLLPIHKAPQVTHQPGNGRKLLDLDQLRFFAFRLRFHLIEGIRYLIEAAQWKRVRADAISHTTRLRVGGAAEEAMSARS